MTQTTHPRLWLAFQFLIGGSIDKGKLCLGTYAGEKSILEVGCSVGNLSGFFRRFSNLKYTGVDIDSVAIDLAKKRFKNAKNFNFLCEDLRNISTDKKFDLILFPGIFHHVENQMCRELLRSAKELLAPGGSIAVIDVVSPEPEDSRLIKMFMKLEQGEYVRRGRELEQIVSTCEGLSLEKSQVHFVGATPLSIPKVARFVEYRLRPV